MAQIKYYYQVQQESIVACVLPMRLSDAFFVVFIGPNGQKRASVGAAGLTSVSRSASGSGRVAFGAESCGLISCW
jgi:hypothetical protein